MSTLARTHFLSINDWVESELEIEMAFGKAIKLRRVEIDITQEALALKSGLARSFVSGVERGAVKASIRSVWSIAAGLECRPSDLWLVAERFASDDNR